MKIASVTVSSAGKVNRIQTPDTSSAEKALQSFIGYHAFSPYDAGGRMMRRRAFQPAVAGVDGVVFQFEALSPALVTEAKIELAKVMETNTSCPYLIIAHTSSAPVHAFSLYLTQEMIAEKEGKPKDTTPKLTHDEIVGLLETDSFTCSSWNVVLSKESSQGMTWLLDNLQTSKPSPSQSKEVTAPTLTTPNIAQLLPPRLPSRPSSAVATSATATPRGSLIKIAPPSKPVTPTRTSSARAAAISKTLANSKPTATTVVKTSPLATPITVNPLSPTSTLASLKKAFRNTSHGLVGAV